MDKTLYILRGVSGCGKTTLASTLWKHLPYSVKYAADDFFYDEDGNYNFDPESLHKAHEWCQDAVKNAMEYKITNIIVHNTNTSEKEIKPYLELAVEHGYKIVSVVVENRHGNKSVHDVPDEALQRQVNRLRHNIKLI